MTTFLSSIRKLSLALICLAIPVAAQTGLGIITGTVTDTSKGAIPNASVSVTNTSTGVVRKSAASATGLYRFTSIAVGPYHLSVEAAGFKTWETDLILQAGQTVTVDPEVTVGDVQSKVEVNSAALQ